jgi:ornithine cyclodeaminase/alanine dehydrogenase-like protein (mu-crystallin family)
MSAELNIDVVPANDPQQVVDAMPIVVTATTSKTPVFDGNWLQPDVLVCAMGSNWLNKAEIDVTTIRRATTTVCDSIECCRREAGDFEAAIEQGAFDWDRAVELASFLVDNATAPRPRGITLFKSVGMAIEDVAVGAKLLDLARGHSVGSSVDLFGSR